jgi:hypothetical protein
MIISGIHIGSDFDRTAMVQLQDDVVTSVISVAGGAENSDTLGAILAMTNMVDLTVVDASAHGLPVFTTLRRTLPHKKITGVSVASGSTAIAGDFIWCAPKAKLLRDLWQSLANGSLTIDCLSPDNANLERELYLSRYRNRTSPGALNDTVCALALCCFARSAMRDLALDPA